MKKIFTYTSILMSVVLFQSCSKQSPDEMLATPQNNTGSSINAVVKTNGEYQLNLNNMQNVIITKQASHFQISQAGYDSKTGLLVYKYSPAQDYIGTDEVLLSASKTTISSGTGSCHNGNNMGDNHTSTTTTTSTTSMSIKINVTN